MAAIAAIAARGGVKDQARRPWGGRYGIARMPVGRGID